MEIRIFTLMFDIKQNIKSLKHILRVWFVLFALSPCVVKEVMSSVVNAEYSKPLNISKTTASTNSCQYSQNDNQQVSVIKQSTINNLTEPVKATENLFLVARIIELNTNCFKTTSSNSPPKYILYKRLKLDVA